MTSKEALEDLFDLLCEREHTNSEHSFWLKLYNTIEQDLEFFETLKKIAYGVGTEEDLAAARKHYEREMKQALEKSYKGCKKLGDIMDKGNNNDGRN